ncbi:MAG: calcium-binding protein, partial [Pseudomonadota bacterium]
MSLGLGVPVASRAAPGDLDPSLDGDGRVLTDLGGFDRAFAVTAQPDGRLVAAGVSFINGSEDFCLARYNVDGGLD